MVKFDFYCFNISLLLISNLEFYYWLRSNSRKFFYMLTPIWSIVFFQQPLTTFFTQYYAPMYTCTELMWVCLGPIPHQIYKFYKFVWNLTNFTKINSNPHEWIVFSYALPFYLSIPVTYLEKPRVDQKPLLKYKWKQFLAYFCMEPIVKHGVNP